MVHYGGYPCDMEKILGQWINWFVQPQNNNIYLKQLGSSIFSDIRIHVPGDSELIKY